MFTMHSKDDNKYYPRVLLINVEPISKRYATGITMGNLFRGWPKDKIAQIYCDDSCPDISVCNRSWHLELEDLQMPEWLRKKIGTIRKQRKVLTKGQQVGNTERRKHLRFRDLMVSFLENGFFKWMKFSSYQISPQLEERVRKFNPDIIYSSLGSLHILKLVQKLSAILKVPIIPHFMDDWIISSYPKEIFSKFLNNKLLNITSKIMKDAPVLLVISESMAEEYCKRYGYVFLPFMNCVDPLARPVIRTESKVNEVFRIGYSGTLCRGRDLSLAQVGEALLVLSNKGVAAEVVIYHHSLNRVNDNVLKIPTIRLATLEEEQLLETSKAKLHALLHIDTFEPESKEYYLYSFSAKFPWYMAAGLPIIAYGPAEFSSIQYIKKHECGIIIIQQDTNILADEILRLINNHTLRKKLGEAARTTAIEKHDAKTQREEFRKAFFKHENNLLLAMEDRNQDSIKSDLE